MYSFKKLIDSPDCLFLLEKHTNAFVLLTLIALRARRDNSFAAAGLSKGQALVGDYEKCGLTREKYRNAVKQLENLGLASFWKTRKGTIATILDTRIYDINPEKDNPETTKKEPSDSHRRTAKQPEKNRETTTNKKIRNKKIININTGELFEKFREIYPRKIGKETARKAFEKLNPDEALTVSIIEALEAQLAAGWLDISWDMKYCPHASTWLNQGRYKDKPEERKPAANPQNCPPEKPEPDYEAIRKRILESAPELNKMFREKVIEPLRDDLTDRTWGVWIKPLVIESLDKTANTAFIYHGMGNSWVGEHYKGMIEERLGMSVRFVVDA